MNFSNFVVFFFYLILSPAISKDFAENSQPGRISNKYYLNFLNMCMHVLFLCSLIMQLTDWMPRALLREKEASNQYLFLLLKGEDCEFPFLSISRCMHQKP